MTLKVDHSPDTGTVVTCTDCPYWFAYRFTRRDGWISARDHEQRAHPGRKQATSALAQYAASGSEKSA